MTENDIELFMLESGCLLEALIKSRRHLKESHLLSKLDILIQIEIEVATLKAEKAKSECLKKQDSKDKVRPIK